MGFKVIIQDEVVWESDDDQRVRRVGLISIGGEKGACLVQAEQDRIELTIETLPKGAVTSTRHENEQYPTSVEGEAFSDGGASESEDAKDTIPGMAGSTTAGSGSAVSSGNALHSTDDSENNGSFNSGQGTSGNLEAGNDNGPFNPGFTDDTADDTTNENTDENIEGDVNTDGDNNEPIEL